MAGQGVTRWSTGTTRLTVSVAQGEDGRGGASLRIGGKCAHRHYDFLELGKKHFRVSGVSGGDPNTLLSTVHTDICQDGG